VLKSVPRGQDREPGVPIVSIIPLDLQRKFERRWAARFLRPPPAPPEMANRETALDQGMAVARVAREEPVRRAAGAGAVRRLVELP
jgi:hypothetical protein